MLSRQAGWILLLALLVVSTAGRTVDMAPVIEAVGRLAPAGDRSKGICGAVLVTPDEALSVGHCIADSRSWQPRPGELLLLLPQATFKVERIRLSPVSPFEADGRVGDLGHDWSVLGLSLLDGVPPAPVALAPASLARAAALTEADLLKVGPVLPGADGASWQGGCRVRGLADDTLFLFRCGDALGPGQSGSALFLADGEGWKLVGLQSAKRGPKGGEEGIAVMPGAAAGRLP